MNSNGFKTRIESRRIKRKQMRLDRKQKKNKDRSKKETNVGVKAGKNDEGNGGRSKRRRVSKKGHSDASDSVKGNATVRFVDDVEEDEDIESDDEDISNCDNVVKAIQDNRKEQTKNRHLLGIEEDEKIIKRMEKKLKLKRNRRKKKNKEENKIPQSFFDEGLGDILEFIDNRHSGDLSVFTRNGEKNDASDDMQSNEDENEENDSDSQNHSSCDEHNNSEIDAEDDIESDAEDDIESDVDDVYEDIYGRVRDKKGNIINDNKPNDSGKSKSDMLLKLSQIKHPSTPMDVTLLRRLRGLVNRLTNSNLSGIASQIEALYKQYTLHEINDALYKCITDSVVVDSCVSTLKLVTEISALVTVLHSMVGEEVGGHFINALINQFDDEINSREEDKESKRIDNIVALIVHLYACGLIESDLIYDIIDKLVNQMSEKCIEIIMFVLKMVGFNLRKDNPTKMKQLIMRIQNSASKVEKSDLVGGNRIGFILDALLAIKNNNTMKFKNSGMEIDVQAIKTMLKNCFQGNRSISSLSGRFEEVLKSNRWWIKSEQLLEEAATGVQRDQHVVKQDVDVSDHLCQLLRLNTPLRRALFNVLISSTDYVDATEKLTRVAKKQAVEVVNVVIHVALHETKFNPFYIHLLKQLSIFDRKYKISIQYACRDKIVDIETLNEVQRDVLALMITDLIKMNVIAVTVLKAVEFAEMNEIYVNFTKKIFESILSDDEKVMRRIFEKIPQKDPFATAIRLFINCFIDTKHKTTILKN